MKKTAQTIVFTLILAFTSVFAGEIRRPIIEVYTGTWAGFSTDTVSYLNSIRASFPEAIVVEVHDADAMATANGTAVTNAMTNSFPTATIDHYKFDGEDVIAITRTRWFERMASRTTTTSPVKVTVSRVDWDPTTREITVRVSAAFSEAASGDLRFNLYVVEDHVTGGAGYDQSNFHNNTAGHPFSGAGNPIEGYIHRNVVRRIAGGPWGVPDIIPANVVPGQSFSHEFTYVLPEDYDENEIQLVGMVQHYAADVNDREILNSDLALLFESTPDGQIGENLNRMRGDDIYNLNSRGQRHRAISGRRKTLFSFATQNDGVRPDDVTTRTRGRVRGIDVKYRQRDSGNVTARLALGLEHTELAVGERAVFKAIVKRKSRDRVSKNLFFESASSHGVDRVMARVVFR